MTATSFAAVLYAGLTVDQRRIALRNTWFQIDMDPAEFGRQVEALHAEARSVLVARLERARLRGA